MEPHDIQHTLPHAPHRFDRILDWRRRHISDKAFIFILATLVGLLSGAGAFVLKFLIGHVSRFLTGHFHAGGANWALLVIPLAGIILTGIFCRYVMKAHLAHGTEQLLRALKEKIYRLKSYITYGPILASTITLGFGGSAGSEGPIAYTGAGIGSRLAQAFKLPPHAMMLLVGCGAGAGIAGIFKSPLGGALFTLEVLRMSMTTYSVLVLLVTTITAAMTAYVLSGCTLDIPFDQTMAFDPSLLPYIAALGIFCGLYSLYYSYVMKKLGSWLEGMSRPWVKNLIGGSILALLVFCFPILYGEGYGVVGKVINGDFSTLLSDSPFASMTSGPWLLILFAGGTLLAKSFATSATNNGGGVSGDFAPTLFAGAIAGFFFASLLNLLFDLQLPVGHFAFYGMAGVMAGAIRAPLMAIFLTCEMGGAYTYFLPLVVAATLSFGIVRLATTDSFFNLHINRHNGWLTRYLKKL